MANVIRPPSLLEQCEQVLPKEELHTDTLIRDLARLSDMYENTVLLESKSDEEIEEIRERLRPVLHDIIERTGTWTKFLLRFAQEGEFIRGEAKRIAARDEQEPGTTIARMTEAEREQVDALVARWDAIEIQVERIKGEYERIKKLTRATIKRHDALADLPAATSPGSPSVH